MSIERMYRPKRSNVKKMEVYYEKLKKQGLMGEDELMGDNRTGRNDNGKSAG